MKKYFRLFLGVVLLATLTGCGQVSEEATVETMTESTEKPVAEVSGKIMAESTDTTEEEFPVDIITESTDKTSEEEITMKLYINNNEIPVTWEDNPSVKAIQNDVENADIQLAMSMYSNNEQVGSLGKSYTSNDKQTTTRNGDIVLYNSSNLVVFYGSNSWAYTRLGKMDLSESEVTELLTNGDVTITLKK